MSKIILIGQAPGPNTDPSSPLHSFSDTGKRLCRLIGVSEEVYDGIFDKVNLLNYFPGRHQHADAFPKREAKIAASAIQPFLREKTVILIGRSVFLAFGYSASHLAYHAEIKDPSINYRLFVIPHPSGRNKWYYNQNNLRESGYFWDKFLRESLNK